MPYQQQQQQQSTSKYYMDADDQGVINAVMSVLSSPPEQPVVANQYSNALTAADSEIEAYAKLSGKDWTYYVKDLNVVIGRNTDNVNLLPAEFTVNPSIHIDLGPTKVVSRKHAVIKFNIDTAKWELFVLGRNGAKVDFMRVKSGPDVPPYPLVSGSIIDIGGVQMIFVLPDQPPTFAESSIEHLVPRLIDSYGFRGNNNSKLRDLIQTSNYMKTYVADKITPGLFNNNEPNSMDSGKITESETASPQVRDPGMSIGTPPTSSPKKVSKALGKGKGKRDKPPQSYATMIAEAILSTEEGIITLASIYEYITTHYPWYLTTKTGWQNSVRHNLSLNTAFEKVPKRINEPGKGMYWRISKQYKDDFMKRWEENRIHSTKRGSAVDRILQLHLSKHQRLPEQKPYEEEPKVITTQDMAEVNSKKRSAEQAELENREQVEAANETHQDITMTSLNQDVLM